MVFGDGVMGMQVFCMDDLYGELVCLWIILQGVVQLVYCVFVEYQVLFVGEGEGLFVGVFYCSLYCGVEGVFVEICQFFQGQFDVVFCQVDVQVCVVVLVVWGGDDVGVVVELGKYVGMIEWLFGEVLVEVFLD